MYSFFNNIQLIFCKFFRNVELYKINRYYVGTKADIVQLSEIYLKVKIEVAKKN